MVNSKELDKRQERRLMEFERDFVRGIVFSKGRTMWKGSNIYQPQIKQV
jgi:hypothetical protein